MYSLSDSQFWITPFVILLKPKLLTYHKEKDYFDPQLYVQSSITNFHVEIRSSVHLECVLRIALHSLYFQLRSLSQLPSPWLADTIFFSGISPPLMQMFYVF